jgi:hypothetical protein
MGGNTSTKEKRRERAGWVIEKSRHEGVGSTLAGQFLSACFPHRPRYLSTYLGQAFCPNFAHFYPHRPEAFGQKFPILSAFRLGI